MELRVSNPDESIAAVPHLMGFRVDSSIVVIPVSRGLPGRPAVEPGRAH